MNRIHLSLVFNQKCKKRLLYNKISPEPMDGHIKRFRDCIFTKKQSDQNFFKCELYEDFYVTLGCYKDLK